MTRNKNQPLNEGEHSRYEGERVRLREDFLLFDTSRKYTHIRYSDDGLFVGLRSSIRLETGLLGNLALSSVAAPYAKERSVVLTPFDREQGYPLDIDDLFVQRRIAKVHRVKREHAGTIQGLSLFVFGGYEDEADNTLLQAILHGDLQKQEGTLAEQLHRLFLTLKFPGGASFTAQAQLNTQHPYLLFRTFFPSDTGPLPRVGNLASPSQISSEPHSIRGVSQGQGSDRTEGFELLAPFDLAKLQTIRAQFLVLAASE